MNNKVKHIPVNTMPSGTREGIFIVKSSINGLPIPKEVEHSHRDNGHLFILQLMGTTHIEIDFQKHCIGASSIIYLNPDQIHRVITLEDATMISWIVTTENLHQKNLEILADISPVDVMILDDEACAIISEMASLCIKLSERKKEKLYNTILQGSFNTLVSLVAAQYLLQTTTAENPSRFKEITNLFKSALEKTFTTIKSPGEYARSLNISTSYLNECIKAVTGQSVSHHIQQRVILEAKRMLYHTSKSVKEIAGELGYDDYSYFTRLFVSVTAMTPVAFRNKNRE
jgi:AraC family transcriptional activator of pobA